MPRLAPLALLLAVTSAHAQKLTQRLTFGGDNTQFFTSALSPDAKIFVTHYAEGAVVRLWDTATGKSIIDIKQKGIGPLEVSPDGKLLLGGGQKGIHLWQIPSGKEAGMLGDGAVGSLAFFDAGKRLASCSGGKVTVWDWAKRKAERSFDLASGVNAFAVSPDGSLLAIGHNDGATVYDMKTGKPIKGLVGPAVMSDRTGTCVAFSPDGRTLLTGHHGSHLYAWEVANWGRRAVSPGTAMMIFPASFSSCGRTVATSNYYKMRLWDLPTNSARDVEPNRYGNIARTHWGPGDKSVFVSTWGMVAAKYDCEPDKDRPAFKPAKAEAAWEELGGPDAEKAYRAMWSLALSDEGVKLLCAKMADTPALVKKRELGVARLIEGLDSDDPSTRDGSSAALSRMGAEVRPDLEKALTGASAELRRRIRRLLDEMPVADPKAVPLAVLHQLRAVEALEYARTKAAREALVKLAKGGDSPVTRSAKASIYRQGK